MSASSGQSATQWVDQILRDAIHKQASDIHIEPQEHQLRVRLRIDGRLQEQSTLPLAKSQGIIARLKIMANLDIGQQRLPQDGRLQFSTSQNSLPDEFRVSTCPTLFGEKLVLRHLDSLDALPSLSSLGMSQSQEYEFRQAIKKPWGLILVTGPTGSGKTVTLYSALNEINKSHRNISTIEDPIEMTLPGINQVQCHEAIGLGFSSMLRAFLRQDPDVLMIGEIRDSVTAKMTIEAAQTGHLVFSTLHTNTALATLTRLRHLGISPHDLSQALRLIVAQSLVRRLHACRQPAQSSGRCSSQFTEHTTNIYQPGQCPKCRSGYLGRIGVFETLSVNSALRNALERGHSSETLAKLLRDQGHVDMQMAAYQHVLSGITSIAELNRIGAELATAPSDQN